MADASPDAPREPRFSTGHESEGRPAALIAWGLYILSLPSANLLVIVGLIVAYSKPSEYEKPPIGKAGEASQISCSKAGLQVHGTTSTEGEHAGK